LFFLRRPNPFTPFWQHNIPALRAKVKRNIPKGPKPHIRCQRLAIVYSVVESNLPSYGSFFSTFNNSPRIFKIGLENSAEMWYKEEKIICNYQAIVAPKLIYRTEPTKGRRARCGKNIGFNLLK